MQKLTIKQVIEIRKRYASDPSETYRGIAKDYGVSYQQIANIVKRANWDGVNDGVPSYVGKWRQGSRSGRAKLVEAQVLEIRAKHAAKNGASMRALASEYGMSTWAIFNIITRRNWRHI